jgi:hypothetical protein
MSETDADTTQPDDFDYEFFSEVEVPLDELKAEAEQRLRKLAADGHGDMIGASVEIDEPAENRATTFIYRARIVAFVRPENLAAEKFADTAPGALKLALDALERQVREKRDRLRERRQRP